MFSNLKDYKVILASKSPRRQELFAALRIPYHTMVIGGIDESYPSDLIAEEVPEFIARKKAKAYLTHFSGNELIITADTLVIAEGRIMGKPRDEADAMEMIKVLAGREHKVVTGVSISTHHKQVTFSDETIVKFSSLTPEEINYYVSNYRPLDKAGAYGIQEWIGYVAVEWIKGSYFNVMGLPVHRLYEALKQF